MTLKELEHEYSTHPMIQSWKLWKTACSAQGGVITISDFHAFKAGFFAAVANFSLFSSLPYRSGGTKND